MLVPTLLVAAAVLAAPADDPIRIQLSDGARYVSGDPGRVRITAREDGYLLVLQADPAGAVRVLFPVDPADDAYVTGGGSYELRDRAGRSGVVRTSTRAGQGMVLAALARGPLDLARVTENGRWRASALTIAENADPEYALLELAEQIAGGRVEYDVASFEVFDEYDGLRGRRGGGAPAYALGLGWGWGAGPWGAPLFWDPYWGWGYSRYGLYGFGSPYRGWGGGWGGWGGWGTPIIIAPGTGTRRNANAIRGSGRRWSGNSYVSPGASSRGSANDGASSSGSRGSSSSGSGSSSSGGSRSAGEGRSRDWGGRSRP